MRFATAGRYRGVDRHGARQASLGVRRLVERRHVDPLERGQPPAQAVARALRFRPDQPIPQHLVDLAHHLLAVAQHEGVDEVGQRFGVEGAVPTGQHQRVGGAPLGRVQRHTGQVDEVHHVGVDELGRQVEGEHVEGGRREVLLDAEEGHPGPAHRLLQIDPGGIRALGHRVRTLVEDLVEDLEALVGQSDLVGVGVEQQPGHLPRAVIGVDRTLFAADVARRLGDLRQQPFELGPDGFHRAAYVTTLAALSRPASTSRWSSWRRASGPEPSWGWSWSASRPAGCWVARSYSAGSTASGS